MKKCTKWFIQSITNMNKNNALPIKLNDNTIGSQTTNQGV